MITADIPITEQLLTEKGFKEYKPMFWVHKDLPSLKVYYVWFNNGRTTVEGVDCSACFLDYLIKLGNTWKRSEDCIIDGKKDAFYSSTK